MSPNRTALLGGLVGALGGTLLPFLVLRPNRLAEGAGHGALGLGPEFWPLLGLPLLALAAALGRPGRARGLLLAALGNAGLVLAVALAGRGAGTLLASAGDFARVSVGASGWLGLAGSGLVLFGAGLDLGGRPGLERLLALWLGPAAALALTFGGGLSGLSVAREYAAQAERFRDEAGRHLGLAAAALGLSALLGAPLGALAARRPGLEGPVLGLAGLLQTVPAVALLGLLIGPLAALAGAVPALAALGVRGIGAAPALVALTLYGLLPVARGAHAGLRSVPAAALEAGRGLGMTGGQLWRRVELPLALPIALAGLRLAAVQLVGLTSLGSLIGAGGLGVFIFAGLGSAAEDLVLLGALPVLGLAFLTDSLFRGLERIGPRP